MQRLHDQCVVMLSQDSFYRQLTPEESRNAAGLSCYPDCPEMAKPRLALLLTVDKPCKKAITELLLVS